jgi:hypothetical protein
MMSSTRARKTTTRMRRRPGKAFLFTLHGCYIDSDFPISIGGIVAAVAAVVVVAVAAEAAAVAVGNLNKSASSNSDINPKLITICAGMKQ